MVGFNSHGREGLGKSEKRIQSRGKQRQVVRLAAALLWESQKAQRRGYGEAEKRKEELSGTPAMYQTLLFFSFCLHDEAGGRYNYLCLPQQETEARRSYITC